MTSAYLTPTTGTGSGLDPYRAATPDGHTYVTLLIDPDKGKALIVSSTDTLSGTGINKLLTAADYPALLKAADQGGPSSQKRTGINAWLTNAGYQPLPAGSPTWRQVVDHACGQANPGASLATTYLA